MEQENSENLHPKKNVGRLQQISEGWFNKAKELLDLLTDEEKEIANKRRAICETCPFNSKNTTEDSSEYKTFITQGYLKLGSVVRTVGDYKSFLPYHHCIWCGCEVDVKPLSRHSNCGLESYNDKFNMNVELKWKAE